MAAMTIGEAAREAGVGVETIRFYERKGLVEQPPKPSYGGFRRYPTATVRRVRFIRQARTLGFSLREIKDLLSLRAAPSTDCADVRRRARIKLEEVDRRLAHLAQVRDGLEELIAACPGRGTLRECSIIEALETGERDLFWEQRP